MKWVEVTPKTCANIDCPNLPHEGTFVLLETPGMVVGGHRKIRMWFCYPCAKALQGIEI